MSRHKVLCRDREWPQQGLCCRDRASHDRGALLPTKELSASRLVRTSSQIISYGNVATWLSLLRQDFGFSVVTVSRQWVLCHERIGSW